MIYCAIIGDIKSSKTLSDRGLTQDKLNEVLSYINKKYENDIAADFLITIGDEFQGLVTDSFIILDIIQYIQRTMYPVETRFGIGLGEITTKINRNAAIGADGPAFWAAREAINRIHNDEQSYKKQAPDIMTGVYLSNKFRINEINTMLLSLKAIEHSWSETVRITVWDMMTHHDTQIECAKRLNVNRATVTKRLSEGNYYIYIKVLDTIKNSIQLLKAEI